MATVSDYLTQLQTDKQTLVNNLVAKGVEATSDETFTTLAPKVAAIPSGDLSEYFKLSPLINASSSHKFINQVVQKLPVFDTSSLTIFDYGFHDSRLREFPQIDTSNGTSFNYMFADCISAKSIPNLDTSNGTSFSNMFYDCREVRTIQGLNTSKGTTFNSMLRSMSQLITLGLLDMGAATNISNMLTGDSWLEHVEGFKDLGKAYDATKGANYNNYTLNLSSCIKLTHDSLINIMNNLYDLNLTYNVAGGGTLAAQSLVFATECQSLLTEEEIAIATNKGWNVSFA